MSIGGLDYQWKSFSFWISSQEELFLKFKVSTTTLKVYWDFYGFIGERV